MTITQVKVGLVGLGLVYESHIKACAAHPDAEVVAVCDLDEAHPRAIAGKYGIRNVYTSYDGMLKAPDVNTVDITTPTILHAPMSIAAGKNIHCKKR